METLLTEIVAVIAIAGAGWRSLRGLHRFVTAVETNTSAVAGLAAELHAHTTQTNERMDRLDQRVTTLETTP